MLGNQLSIIEKTSTRISQIIFNLENQGEQDIDND
jgi:hypothetical protein